MLNSLSRDGGSVNFQPSFVLLGGESQATTRLPSAGTRQCRVTAGRCSNSHELAAMCVSVAYMLHQVLYRLPRASFQWEFHVEMIIMVSVLPVYDILWCLYKWYRTEKLDWKGHLTS